jgi:hypothetical protein
MQQSLMYGSLPPGATRFVKLTEYGMGLVPRFVTGPASRPVGT